MMSAVLCCCSDGRYTHKAAKEAAEKYYTMLIQGKYGQFVDGFADSESLPEDHKKEMADVMRQFMAEGNMPNLRSVEAVSDSLAEDSTAYVMLQLHFADSTSEQVGLPLILKEGKWKTLPSLPLNGELERARRTKKQMQRL